MTQRPMQLTPEELERITGRTLAHYDRNAQAFWESTRDHDVSQNIDALLFVLDPTAPDYRGTYTPQAEYVIPPSRRGVLHQLHQ